MPWRYGQCCKFNNQWKSSMGFGTGMCNLSYRSYWCQYRICPLPEFKGAWRYVLFRMPWKSSCHVSIDGKILIITSQSNTRVPSKIKTIGSCGYCHDNSRGEGASGEFAEVHGGTNPEKSIGCRACHTSISTNSSSWPHAYTWKNSN